ncbi:MAG: hypothetical protein Q9160_001785 [Pyrenula sp. 1 TL-2023]
MAQSIEQASGSFAPRQYLTTHLSPSLKSGMVQACRAQPENVLRYLGEYLIAQSILKDPSQNTDITQHFLYDHSEPQQTPAPPIQAPIQTTAPVDEAAKSTATYAQPAHSGGETDVKMETQGDVTMGGDGDHIMTDENANEVTAESAQPSQPASAAP